MPSATTPTARITEKAKSSECDGRGDKMGEQVVLLGQYCGYSSVHKPKKDD